MRLLLLLTAHFVHHCFGWAKLVKIVPEMTNYVSGGTLKLTHSQVLRRKCRLKLSLFLALRTCGMISAFLVFFAVFSLDIIMW